MKDAFKKSIDDMPDEDFLDLVSFLMFSAENFEDEEWEYEAEKFYNQRNNKSNNDNLINEDDLPF